MKRNAGLVFFLVASLTLGACVSAPLQGFLYTNTEQHMYGLSPGGQIGSGRILKKAESCSSGSWLFEYALFNYGFGEGIRSAIMDAEITRVAVVDRSSTSILGYLYFRECTVVWGE